MTEPSPAAEPDVPGEPAPTYARGVRRPYADQPAPVQTFVADVLGGPVISVRDCVGGFAPGTAAVVGSRDRSVFVKIASSEPNPQSLELYRQERRRLAALPDHPRIVTPLVATELVLPEPEPQTYAITVFPALPGRPPTHPWSESMADRVLTAWGELGAHLVEHGPVDGPDAELGDPSRLPGFFGRWAEVLDDGDDPWCTLPWVQQHAEQLVALDTSLQADCQGDAVAHTDLRADNVMVHGSDVWFVDWAGAQPAAPWVDPAILACDLVASGADRGDGGGLDLWAFLDTHPTTAAVGRDRLRTMMVGVAGTLHRVAQRPAPAGLPTIGAWQHLTAERVLRYVARTWDRR